jgi:hypothetical protein
VAGKQLKGRRKSDKKKSPKRMAKLKSPDLTLRFTEGVREDNNQDGKLSPSKNYSKRKEQEDGVKMFGDTKKSLMAQRARENDLQYRAFLLWAMQTPHKREYAMIARAIGRSHVTVSNYKKKHDWESRASHISADVEAQAIYRERFLETMGMGELNAVSKNIVTPVSIVGKNPREMTDAVEKVLRKTNEPAQKTFEKEVQRKHLMLIDAALGYLAQGIKDGDIRRSLRDIPTLLQLRNELTGEGKEEKGKQVIVESLRVQEAKLNGEDVLEAMYEDAKELQAILGSLSQKGKAEAYVRKNSVQE